MHTLIVGERHVGKSTLIGRVLNALDRPVYGFETKKRTPSQMNCGGAPSISTTLGRSGCGRREIWWVTAKSPF